MENSFSFMSLKGFYFVVLSNIIFPIKYFSKIYTLFTLELIFKKWSALMDYENNLNIKFATEISFFINNKQKIHFFGMKCSTISFGKRATQIMPKIANKY